MTDSVSSSTLRSPRVAAVLDRLWAESAASDVEVRALLGAMPPDERARRLSTVDGYRDLYGRARDHYLAVGPATARLLTMLARASRASTVVEFGTSFGISTIHLAAALRDNGGGRVIGTELEPSKAATARANLAAAGLDDLVEIREGDALETLARELPPTIDLVLLDGHKPLYAAVLDRLRSRLRRGALLVADNVDACPDYVARVRGAGFLSVPFADDVEVSQVL